MTSFNLVDVLQSEGSVHVHYAVTVSSYLFSMSMPMGYRFHLLIWLVLTNCALSIYFVYGSVRSHLSGFYRLLML